MKITYLLIFIGGALGAMIRECIMILIPTLSNGFPLDIFIANLTASFLLGYVTHQYRVHHINQDLMILFSVGILGGMSTFSSFIYGAFHDIHTLKEHLIGFIYLISSVVFGFIAAWIGLYMSDIFTSSKNTKDEISIRD